MIGTLILTTLASASSASAHNGCGGHEGLGRRNELITGPAGASAKFGKRDVTIDTAGCEGYYYPAASALVPSYPTTWQTATILPNDTDASAAYSAISAKLSSSFPNDKPHGQPNGNWSGVTYNGGQDPDCWWTYTTCTTPKNDTGLDADVTVVPEPGVWGLTVDDGPNCDNGFFYDYFKQNDYKATLFYIGSNVMNWPYQGLRGVDDGHEICVHTWSHQYMTALSDEEVFAELYYTRKIIKELLGVTPTCWRPPYGDVDNRVRLVAKELGLTTVIWSEDTDDWSEGTGTPPAKIDANYQAIIDKQTNHTYSTYGPIVLAHELTNFTMNEMVKYLPAIKSAFAHVVPVAVAYNQTTPYVEQDIVFPTFEQFIGGDEGVVTTSLASTASAFATGSAGSMSGASGGATPTSGSNSGSNYGAGNKENAGPSASVKPSSGATLSMGQAQISGWAGAVLGLLAAVMAL